jgi:hypothetical protein
VGLTERRRLGDQRPIAAAGGSDGLYLEVARMYSSPLLLGPPICDELIALV